MIESEPLVLTPSATTSLRRTCGAKTKGTGKPCRRPPMANGRCWKHGGPTPKGMESPHFKTGRYSKYMPTKLLSKFAQAYGDPELFNMSADMALLEARMLELLERINAGASAEWVEGLGEAWGEYQAARTRRPPDEIGIRASIERIGELIQVGLSEHHNWTDIQDVMLLRKKLADSERRRMVDAQQMISLREAMTLIEGLTEIVRTHVQDQHALAAISQDFARRLGPASSR